MQAFVVGVKLLLYLTLIAFSYLLSQTFLTQYANTIISITVTTNRS